VFHVLLLETSYLIINFKASIPISVQMKIITFLLTSAIVISTSKISLASATAKKQSVRPTAKVSLSQSNEVVCGGTTYVRAETKGFYVNICGNSSGGKQWVGSGKGGQALVIPLKSSSGGKYVAVSGTVRYTLTSSALVVTQNGRTIVNQEVISWR
jgi:hypothetical protein